MRYEIEIANPEYRHTRTQDAGALEEVRAIVAEIHGDNTDDFVKAVYDHEAGEYLNVDQWDPQGRNA